MNLDERLQKFKLDSMQIRIEDKKLFKANVMKRIEHTNKKKMKRKWMAVLAPLIVLPLGGWGYEEFHIHYTMWHRVHVTNAQPTQPVPTIAEVWSNTGLSTITNGAFHVTDLHQSRAKANFPIYEPKHISGWNLIFSKGYTTHMYVQHVVNHQNVTDKVTESPLTYLDVYSNSRGDRVAILQQKSDFNSNNPNVYVQFPANTQYLTSFNPDFAALSPVKIMQANSNSPGMGNPHELSIFHKNANGTITNFQITGTAPDEILEMFGREYVSAPSK
ncbi:hypothetical protein [Alicyclobacillus fastidiosus]|uniref:DUF4367 domain-containing protein n=1 Tax=Alicyclobacillus fastidiosus TaxID=392011 RepID=A0ABV5ALA7_9BACL|nr:hypothetical protein [Alicyclobacillus fastidiosus]WEH08496.1 hypothetical protein PYS47_17640 [Alicyclobacillus fastidiosus]